MVLLPCSRCCQPAGECACVCQCCECSSDAAEYPDAWERALLTPLGEFADHPGVGDRYLGVGDYLGLVAYLPDCGISRRWESKSACVEALIAAEKAAILANGGPPYAYNLIGATLPYPPEPTSSLSPDDRHRLLVGLSYVDWEHPLLSGPVSLADEDAVNSYIDELFGPDGPLDATRDYWGFCSDYAAAYTAGGYYLGWSIPYRDGSPLTAADLKSLCPSGAPFLYGDPPAAWGRAAFLDDSVPIIRSVVLASSTGDAIADRLIETGTQAIEVVEDELGYELPDWTKAITVEHQECNDLALGVVGWPGGTKTVTVTVTYDNGTTHKEWELTIVLRACTNREDTETGEGVPLGIESYQLWYDDDPPNNPVSYQDKIASTASIRPYIDENDCDGMRDDSPCANGAWQTVTLEEAGVVICCNQFRVRT